MITNTVELISERIENPLPYGSTEYVCTRYIVRHKGMSVLVTEDFAVALQAYINRVII